MVPHGERLFLNTTREIEKKKWADTITVLSKKDGAYLRTIDVKPPILEMAIFSGHLALAPEEGLRFISPE